MPVAVHNLSLAFEATRYFNLITDGVNGGSGFEPVILQPGETKDLSFLSLKDEAWEDRILNSILTIHTNISNIHVPLLCFHGLIDTVSILFINVFKENVTSLARNRISSMLTHTFSVMCFVHRIFGFWFFVTFGNEVTKI